MGFPFATEEATRLTTKRLLLEPLVPDDASEMVEVLDDPELYRYVGGQPLLPEELRERYDRQAIGRSDDGDERWFNWIIREHSGNPVGYVQATVEVASGVADVAWVVGPRFQRRGYAKEAASTMVSWLRSKGVISVTAHIHPDNSPSERVARAIGLAPCASMKDGDVRWDGQY